MWNHLSILFLFLLSGLYSTASDTTSYRISDRFAYYHQHELDTNTLEQTILNINNPHSYTDTAFIYHGAQFSTYLFVYDSLGILKQNKAVQAGKNLPVDIFTEDPGVSVISLPPHTRYEVHIWKHPLDTAKIRTMNKVELLTHLHDKRRQDDLSLLINTLSLGFLTLIFVFFLFYSLVARQPVFYTYLLYLFFALIFFVSMGNILPYHAQQFLGHLAFLRDINETATAWMFIFYVLFTDRILNISEQDKFLKQFFKIIILVLFIYGLFHLFVRLFYWSGTWVDLSYVYFRIVFLPVFLSVLILIYYRIRGPLKLFYMIASYTLLISATAAVLVHFIVGQVQIGQSILQPAGILRVGIVLETLCFSLALGYYSHLHRVQRDEQEKRLQSLTLQSIATQMNPHFLFNGINAIRDLIHKGKKDESLDYINIFALLLRTGLAQSQQENISLAKQLQHLRLYLTIEKLRLGESFEFKIHNPEDLDLNKIMLPVNLLQPVVENAIKHGIRPSTRPIKRIDIQTEATSEGITITIQDNGIGLEQSIMHQKKDPLKSTNLGLKLVNDKIDYFNQQKKGSYLSFSIMDNLHIPSELNEGTTAIYKLKINA